MAETVQRRLAAILAADVVGYSRLMSEDEAGTLAVLKAHREELIDPKVAEHKGRIVKLMGDGALVEFPSVIEAVQCAIEVQRGMSARNANVPENRRVQFRIGVNLGDVIVDGDDIYGDGVNIAARLETLAAPSGICVSDMVQRSVDGKLEIEFEDLGERETKNIAKPVHVYRVAIDREPGQKDVANAQESGFRRRWFIGLGILAILIAGVMSSWLLLELGRSASSEPDCTDHLGLPVTAEKCAQGTE